LTTDRLSIKGNGNAFPFPDSLLTTIDSRGKGNGNVPHHAILEGAVVIFLIVVALRRRTPMTIVATRRHRHLDLIVATLCAIAIVAIVIVVVIVTCRAFAIFVVKPSERPRSAKNTCFSIEYLAHTVAKVADRS
jgi:hypothetical protein